MGTFILTIDELACVIYKWFSDKHINCTLTPDVITGQRAKPLYELEVLNDVAFATVVNEIRQALDSKAINYYESYTMAAESTDFRFITPDIDVFQ